MRRAVISALLLLCGAAASANNQTASPLSKGAKKELERLQGKWVVKEMRVADKKIELTETDPTLILEIKGAKWIFTGAEKGEFVAIDPTTDPKCYDLKSVEKGRKGQVDEGIYKVDGDTLTVCFNQGKQKQRPIAFETSPEQPDTILAVLRRVKEK
jgi:uncharacterized protein (TIGR03067 family)